MSTAPAVALITMGCAKNEVDSAAMAQRLAQAGYRLVDDAECADVVVVNTCSFIQAATEESIEAVLEAAAVAQNGAGDAKLVLAGCMAARYGRELEPEFPEVDAFVPCAEEQSIAEVVDGLLGRSSGLPGTPDAALQDEGVFAYVKISEGCDRFCSYCTIPFIRGRYRSFSFQEIEAEVARQISAGKREVVLIAQDTGRWGEDLEEPSTLARLVSDLARAHPETWFRLMYIQPEGVTDELIRAVASHDNICNYFDIPFQHCDPAILQAMNRRGDAEEHLRLIGRLRTAIPDVVLRTTLICGFPGETEERFEALCDFVEQAELDYVGAFAYSREEGTRAFDLPDQVEEDEKAERVQRLRDLADDISSAVIAARIGKTYPVLVCSFEEDGQRFGRTQGQAPDVDGVTYIAEGQPGDILACRIEDTLLYEMEGVAVHG